MRKKEFSTTKSNPIYSYAGLIIIVRPHPFASLFNISTMTFLELQANQFSGHLPSTMGQWLPNLQYFSTNINNLGGTIPKSLSNASMLTTLAMQYNYLTGTMQNTLGNLRNLHKLYLAENNLVRDTSSLQLQFINSSTNCRYLKVVELS